MSMNSQRHTDLAPRRRCARNPWALNVLLAAALAAPCVQAQQPAASRAQPETSRAGAARGLLTMNFVNADIEAVTRAVGAMINRQITVDPRVKGTITVYSEQPQTAREAFLSYQSALRGLGFSLVESGGLLKVVPEADAKLQTGTVAVGESSVRGDQVITQIFSLRYENANNLVAVLRPLITANNTINASPGTNSLVITDYADNLLRISKIVSALDVPSATDLEVIPLKHAVASDIAVLVQRLSDGGGQMVLPGGVPGGGGATTVMADARSNSLIVRAPNAARLNAIRNTIDKLDRPSAGIGPGGGMWVVHLKNADAVKLATVVRAAFAAVGSGSTGGASAGGSTPVLGANPGQGAGGLNPAGGANNPFGAAGSQATAPIATSAQPSTGGFIQADPSTNSLIITAPEPLYRQVRAMIDQLDTRRAQVSIEGLIVEVNGGDAADFGVQWLGELATSGNRSLQAGTVLPTANNPSIVSLNAGIATGQLNLGSGLNVGIVRTIGNALSLNAIVRLLQTQSATNILSTPNVLTLDNEEAKIVVGNNVPFLTGQFANTGTGNTSAFQTIERKDVGLTLRIKPQIGESGAIRMSLFLENSDVIGQATGTAGAGPTTSKRSVESNVVVDDNQILVIGGLIRESFDETKSKVPLLGDLPWVGGLFRSESRTKNRTNLMIFLRPTVLRDSDSATRLSLDRYDIMRAEQKDTQPRPSIVMPINESPVLPPMRTPSGQPVTPMTSDGTTPSLAAPLPASASTGAVPRPVAPSSDTGP